MVRLPPRPPLRLYGADARPTERPSHIWEVFKRRGSPGHAQRKLALLRRGRSEEAVLHELMNYILDYRQSVRPPQIVRVLQSPWRAVKWVYKLCVKCARIMLYSLYSRTGRSKTAWASLRSFAAVCSKCHGTSLHQTSARRHWLLLIPTAAAR